MQTCRLCISLQGPIRRLYYRCVPVTSTTWIPGCTASGRHVDSQSISLTPCLAGLDSAAYMDPGSGLGESQTLMDRWPETKEQSRRYAALAGPNHGLSRTCDGTIGCQDRKLEYCNNRMNAVVNHRVRREGERMGEGWGIHDRLFRRPRCFTSPTLSPFLGHRSLQSPSSDFIQWVAPLEPGHSRRQRAIVNCLIPGSSSSSSSSRRH
jgi:hypothetical protein